MWDVFLPNGFVFGQQEVEFPIVRSFPVQHWSAPYYFSQSCLIDKMTIFMFRVGLLILRSRIRGPKLSCFSLKISQKRLIMVKTDVLAVVTEAENPKWAS